MMPNRVLLAQEWPGLVLASPSSTDSDRASHSSSHTYVPEKKKKKKKKKNREKEGQVKSMKDGAHGSGDEGHMRIHDLE